MLRELKVYSVFLGIWLLGFSIVRHIDSEGIVFYQGIVLSLITAVFLSLFCKKNISLILAVFFTTLFINGVIITTVDRAYSVKMIEWLGAAPSGLEIQTIEGMFSQKFVKDGGVDKRIKEQVASGFMEVKDGRVYLTRSGVFLVHCFDNFRRGFNLK